MRQKYLRMEYFLPKNNSYVVTLKNLEQFLIPHRTAKDSINKRFPDSIYCENGLKIGLSSDTTFFVEIKEIGPQSVEYFKNALRDYLSIAGTPNFVNEAGVLPFIHIDTGKSHKTLDEILSEFGKKLNRTFTGGAVGKRVVDLK